MKGQIRRKKVNGTAGVGKALCGFFVGMDIDLVRLPTDLKSGAIDAEEKS